MTSPEELAAAAHSSCFSMALALRLGEHGATPHRLDVTATVSLAEVDGRPTVVESVLRVIAQVTNLDPQAFHAIVDEAKALCPISRLFVGAVITVDAYLDVT
jgi:osmotically inducible protein OsmC